MAEKTNVNQDRDNSIRGELLQQLDNEKELQKVLSIQKPVIDTSDNPPAKDFWSTGRGCPKCKRTLAIKELNEDTGELWVFCNSCRTEYCASDLENTNEYGDRIHRSIPDELMLRWMAAREDEIKRRESKG